jgi:drug/metabolite transporter (DMT)-like permease
MKNISHLDIVSRAKLACIYSGVTWGLFWIPLRMLDRAGIYGAWATVLFYAVPLLLFLPYLVLRWNKILSCGLTLHLIGIASGTALAFYANALIYTEVVRGLLLFYLTPVWSLILARIALGEAITPPRVAAILLGLSGMVVMLGIDVGIPLPRNVGDWMGLLGGLGWAVAAVLLRQDDGSHAMEFTLSYFFWGSVAAIIIAVSPIAGDIELPTMGSVWDVMPWFLVVALVLVIPAAWAVIWGAPHLNPGVVALLFMIEVGVGTITAAIWAGEPFGWRELTGVVLITLAGLTELFTDIGRRIYSKIVACGD